jgi:chromate reductase
MPLILGISGSLREGSHNTVLLRAAATQLPPGVSLDVEPADPAVSRFRDAIARADGVLIATPEYNGSIPGVLKNALDWASRPFPDNALRGKPVGVIGASTGLFGAVVAGRDAQGPRHHRRGRHRPGASRRPGAKRVRR